MKKTKKMSLIQIEFAIVLIVIGLSLSLCSAFEPNGAELTAGISERAPNSSAEIAYAQAGNVTQLNIFGYSITQTWQGYFGNVSGVIELANSNNRVMYNWTLAEAEGEVYASTNSSIMWNNVQCFNFSSTGTYIDEAGLGGTTNQHGLNLTGLENRFDINYSDVDGIDETFNELNHDMFYTANKEFSDNECRSTHMFNNGGTGIDGQFEEVLLYEPVTASVIFTALLERGDVVGFNDRDNDFEMMVLENGHGSDTSSTPYYFFVEIE